MARAREDLARCRINLGDPNAGRGQVDPEEPASAVVGGGRIVARVDREPGGVREVAAIVGGDADTVLRRDGHLAWILIVERQIGLDGNAGQVPYRRERRVGPVAGHCIRCRRDWTDNSVRGSRYSIRGSPHLRWARRCRRMWCRTTIRSMTKAMAWRSPKRATFGRIRHCTIG
jgi:hypothetical protein